MERYPVPKNQGLYAKILAMAARSDYRPVPLPVSLVDLRDLQPSHLDALLQEEAREWLTDLDWDFEPSANLVRRFIAMRSLMGFALLGKGIHSLAGYAYYVCG